MSNSVRSLGSGRGVDASTRLGGAHQPDAIGTDAEFATVMNLAIGAMEGAANPGNGDGTSAENGLAGQGGQTQGETPTIAGQIDNTADKSGDMPSNPVNVAVSTNGPDSKSSPLGATKFDASSGEEASRFVPMVAKANANSAIPALSTATLPQTGLSPNGITTTRTRRQSDDAARVPQSGEVEGQTISSSTMAMLGQAAIATTEFTTVKVDQSGGDEKAANDIQALGTTVSDLPTPVPAISADNRSVTSSDPASSSKAAWHWHGLHTVSTVSPPTSGSIGDHQSVTASNVVVALPQIVGATIVFNAGDASVPTGSVASLKTVSGQLPHAESRQAPPQSGTDRLGWRVRTDTSSQITAPATASTQAALTLPTGPDIADFDSRHNPFAQGEQSTSTAGGGQNQLGTNGRDPTADNASTVTIDSNSPPNFAVVPEYNQNAASATPAQTPPVLTFAATSVPPMPATDPRSGDPPTLTAVDSMTGSAPLAPSDAATGAPPDLTASSNSPSASFTETLANHVMSMVSNGRQEATLQLQPPQLGDITIRVAVQGRDVSTWFGAAQPQVQVAVSQALDQLRTDLAGAGLNLAGAWVGADTSGTRQAPFEAAATPTRRPIFTTTGESSAIDGGSAARPSGLSVYV